MLRPSRRCRAIRALSILAVGSTIAPAQQTFVVNAAGGPGVNFLDVPSAVAAASDGDTILVFTGPQGQGLASFATSKGLTIVGVGGNVPVELVPWPGMTTIDITNLPAGRAFRMVGFAELQWAPFRITVASCDGSVHLEDIVGYNSTLSGTDIWITDSASVTLRDCSVVGAPAVWVDTSTVSIVSSQLIGNPCLTATDAVVDIVQPLFTPWWTNAAIHATNTTLRVAGDVGGSIPTGAHPQYPQPTVLASGGSVTLDPAVRYLPAGPSASGATVVSIARVPASWTLQDAVAGATLSIRSTAAPGAAVFQAIGSPGVLAATPLGLLGIDAALPFAFFAPVVVSPTASTSFALPIPAAIPRGFAVATQAVVLDQGALLLAAATTFVVQ